MDVIAQVAPAATAAPSSTPTTAEPQPEGRAAIVKAYLEADKAARAALVKQHPFLAASFAEVNHS